MTFLASFRLHRLDGVADIDRTLIGVGCNHLLLSGRSAGAHLVALARDHPRVAAGLAFSGVINLGRGARLRPPF